MKKKIFIILGVTTLSIIGLYLYFDKEEKVIIEPIAKEITKEEIIENCYVDVKGEVVNPGVYECENNSKVIDIINLAGGLTKNADVSVINLSKTVHNEMLIIIYNKKQIEDAKKRLNEPTIIEVIKEIEKECICPDVVNEACPFTEPIKEEEIVKEENVIEDTNTKVNINTSNKEELMTLPKIGEAKALSIINYRTTKKFEKTEDIMEVSGIGDSIFNDIKDLIEV